MNCEHGSTTLDAMPRDIPVWQTRSAGALSPVGAASPHHHRAALSTRKCWARKIICHARRHGDNGCSCSFPACLSNGVNSVINTHSAHPEPPGIAERGQPANLRTAFASMSPRFRVFNHQTSDHTEEPSTTCQRQDAVSSRPPVRGAAARGNSLRIDRDWNTGPVNPTPHTRTPIGTVIVTAALLTAAATAALATLTSLGRAARGLPTALGARRGQIRPYAAGSPHFADDAFHNTEPSHVLAPGRGGCR